MLRDSSGGPLNVHAVQRIASNCATLRKTEKGTRKVPKGGRTIVLDDQPALSGLVTNA